MNYEVPIEAGLGRDAVDDGTVRETKGGEA